MRSRLVRCLTLATLALPLPLLAATPSGGTLTDVSGPLDYTAGPFTVANPTPVIEVDQGPECNNPVQPCDDYALTVTLPAGYHAAHPLASVKVSLSWVDSGSGSSDYDLYVYAGNVTSTSGAEEAFASSASGANPELATFSSLADGSTIYTIKVVPFTPTGETVDVHVELLPGGTPPDSSFGGADAVIPGAPRYQVFAPPAGSSAESGAGEFNIGFDPATHRIMTMNSGPIWRVTPPEVATAGTPESCPALWEDRSALTTNTGLDPILVTDQPTGRTFASNSTVGANAVYAYSDDDGDTWVEIGAGPPSGGADHETIGTGPFPASQSILVTPVNHGRNTLYCSQDVVGPATCQRSLDLGMSWGPGVPAYEGNGLTQCEGLHGHAKIGPDGTAWLPVGHCGSSQGGALSHDGGLTWSEFLVSGSHPQTNGADPSMAIDAGGTVYYCYVDNAPVAPGNAPEGHVHAQVSHDGGVTWGSDVDLGASHGIVNAVHPEAVAGTAGRAACGFIGTNVGGDYQALGFPGNWYAFIATTYDAGQHWVTINATPNDPVQRAAGVWQGGGGHTQRNLLDFNEVTLDDQGRVLYGYSDGCVSNGCVAGTAANDFVGHMRVARQTGGKGLLASADVVEPAAPKRACLAGTRDATAAHLTWAVPDPGGASITAYQIFRGTTMAQQSLIASIPGGKAQYEDASTDPAIPTYYYSVKAVNNAATGGASNVVALTVVVPPPPENVCEAPGLSELGDAAGDTSTIVGVTEAPAPPGADLLSLKLVQPYELDGDVRLVFTLHTDAGASPQPPGSAWYVAMKIPDPPPAKTFHYRAVHMTWNGTTPTFESYTPGANNSGGVDGRFVTAGTQQPAESGSYDAPYDQVTITVKASDLGLAAGDTIAGFVAGVSQTADGVVTGLYDQMPDSLAYTGSYTVRNNRLCAPNTPPVAMLQGAPTAGCAPLTVTFDGSTSHDDDGDAITSYGFDFGAGGASQVSSAPAATKTYSTAGNYVASLIVADERGAVSTNSATVPVTVSSVPATPVISAPGHAYPGQTGLVASVADGGATYQWSIQNGSITAGQGTAQITFDAGEEGDLTLSVTATQDSCTSASGRVTIEVKDALFSDDFEGGNLDTWSAGSPEQ